MNTFSFCFPTGNESFVGHVWQAGNDNFNLPFLEGLHLPYTTQSVFFFLYTGYVVNPNMFRLCQDRSGMVVDSWMIFYWGYCMLFAFPAMIS